MSAPGGVLQLGGERLARVACDAEQLRCAAGLLHQRGEAIGVRRDDLVRSGSAGAGLDQLIARGQDGDDGSAAHAHLGVPGGGDERDGGGVEPAALP